MTTQHAHDDDRPAQEHAQEHSQEQEQEHAGEQQQEPVQHGVQQGDSDGDHDRGEGDHAAGVIGAFEQDDLASPEGAVAESLRAALQQIRADADAIEGLPTGEQRAAAAERLAEDAGALDEQIGSIARADGEHD